MRDFGSFFKKVGGNEGDKCNYSTRLDTYGCGCAHDCDYCYAKSLLSFRNLWNPKAPAVATISEISRAIKRIPRGETIRLGGMTDCFQPAKRLQLQERLAEDIAECISLATGSKDVFVNIVADHACVSARGAKSDGITDVTTLKGRFLTDQKLRDEIERKIIRG